MNGKLIVFEGPDGSGKSTILKNVNKKLLDLAYDTMVVREPGGTEISEKIREIIIDNDNKDMNAKTEALLFAASRAQLVEEKIKPGLKAGKIILCDRFVLSSLFYQGVGRKLGVENIRKINEFATGNLSPDLTVFFNIDYKTALLRKRANFVADRLENEEFDFHKEIYDAYINYAKESKDQIKEVDASLSIDEVSKNVLEIVLNLLED